MSKNRKEQSSKIYRLKYHSKNEYLERFSSNDEDVVSNQIQSNPLSKRTFINKNEEYTFINNEDNNNSIISKNIINSTREKGGILSEDLNEVKNSFQNLEKQVSDIQSYLKQLNQENTYRSNQIKTEIYSPRDNPLSSQRNKNIKNDFTDINNKIDYTKNFNSNKTLEEKNANFNNRNYYNIEDNQSCNNNNNLYDYLKQSEYNENKSKDSFNNKDKNKNIDFLEEKVNNLETNFIDLKTQISNLDKTLNSLFNNNTFNNNNKERVPFKRNENMEEDILEKCKRLIDSKFNEYEGRIAYKSSENSEGKY